MVEEGEKAIRDLREAREALSAVPPWAPGRAVVNARNQTAKLTIQGVNLILIGAQELDAALMQDGTGLLDDANDAKFEAAALLVELEAETGVGCF